jgi:hypothetical protein
MRVDVENFSFGSFHGEEKKRSKVWFLSYGIKDREIWFGTKFGTKRGTQMKSP